MKISKVNLPVMSVKNLYQFKDQVTNTAEKGETSTCSDPTTACTTILTTTHLKQR